MCQKCNYRVRATLKDEGQPETCFIQIGLNSENVIVQRLARSVMRSVFDGMTLDEFSKRLYFSFKNNDMEPARKEAYITFLRTVPGFDKIDEDAPDYDKEVLGGLVD